MPAGPSEVAVLADETANPTFVASDLLSQAEHGADSQAILITTSETLIDKVAEEVDRQLSELPRKSLAEKSLQSSKLILVRNMQEAIDMINEYAPEHLIIETKDYTDIAEKSSMQVLYSYDHTLLKVQAIMLREPIIHFRPTDMPKHIVELAWIALSAKLLSRKLPGKESLLSDLLFR